MSNPLDLESIFESLHAEIDTKIQQATRDITEELHETKQEVLRAALEGKIYPMSNLAAQRLADTELPREKLEGAMGDWTKETTREVGEATTTHSARIVASAAKHPKLYELDRSLENVTGDPVTSDSALNDPGEYPFVDEVMERMGPKITSILSTIPARTGSINAD